MIVYNEIDRFAAGWLRSLIDGGHIAPGDVDERSIVELGAAQLAPAVQFHAFAGIGGWSAALRLAGWPDDREAWTVSCPCQPFSAAGRRGGFDDVRHLWPVWFALAQQCRPRVILGEQVASRDGLAWLDTVLADLEGAGYAVGAFDLCAAGFGAPHIRQRLYFVAVRVADGDGAGPQGRGVRGRGAGERTASPGGMAGGVSYAPDSGRGKGRLSRGAQGDGRGSADGRGLGDASREGGRGLQLSQRRSVTAYGDAQRAGEDVPGPVNGYWRGADWIGCTDGKARPVEPGTQPLADGVPGRVGRLRGTGNAIVVPQAAAFVRCVMEALA